MLAISLSILALVSTRQADPHLVAKVPADSRVLAGSVRFSTNGTKCVYVVSKGDEWHPVVGDALGAAYDEVSWPSIDPSGSHTAFRVREGSERKKITYSILYDGKVLATDVYIGPIALDPAKGSVAYWIAHGVVNTASGRLEPQAATLVWGKYKSSKWQFAEAALPPLFTPDGKILVTSAARGNGDWNVVTVDDKGRDDKHASGSIFEAFPRPTGRAVAYTFAHLVGEERWIYQPQQFLVATASLDQRGDKAFIALYGEKYASSGSPVFTDDGLHIAYKVMKSSKMGVAVDDQENAACDFDFVGEIAPKPDGSEVAFTACNGCKIDHRLGREVLNDTLSKGGKWLVVHGKHRYGEYDLARFPAWSKDGKTLAYASKTGGKWYLHVGAKRSEACDEIACLEWADDGKRVAYGCRDGAELWWRTLDAE